MDAINLVITKFIESKQLNLVKKKEYTVQVYKPPLNTKVYNYLEDSIDYTDETKPYVIIGLLNEKWTMNEKKLIQIYNVDISKITEIPIHITTKTNKDAPQNFCIHIPLFIQFEIITKFKNKLKANRSEVEHDLGDYLLFTNINGRPNLDDKWIVNGQIFEKTYEKI